MTQQSEATKLVEGIPIPSHLDVRWTHDRYVEPIYYGEQPQLLSMTRIRRALAGKLLTGDILARGGGTYCELVEVAEEVKADPDRRNRDHEVVVGQGYVKCSKQDNFVKAIGRRRSLSKALSDYHGSSYR